MTDREQAIKDVAEAIDDSISFVEAYADEGNEDDSYGITVEYAVSQRERVIQLERALREIRDDYQCDCELDDYKDGHAFDCLVGKTNRLLEGQVND